MLVDPAGHSAGRSTEDGQEEEAADEEAADADLQKALDIAAQEGFRLPFLQLGEPVRRLLSDSPISRMRFPELVLTLLDEIPAESHTEPDLVDPLTTREVEILRYLGAGLDSKDIAAHLFVSHNTVRTHTKSIYRKLGVSSRREAILRSRALGVT